MSATDPLRDALRGAREALHRACLELGSTAGFLQDFAAINKALAAVPAEPDHEGIPAVWVCDRCGQPMGRGDRCNSGLHVGPGEEANGMAVASTALVAERDALRAEVKRLRGAEPERNDERDQIAVCEHCNVVVARGGERIVGRPATVCSHLHIRTYLPADTRPAEPEAWPRDDCPTCRGESVPGKLTVQSSRGPFEVDVIDCPTCMCGEPRLQDGGEHA